MNNKKKIEMLKEYLKINIAPILIDFVDKDFFEDKVIIDAKCKKEELIEIYDKEKTLPPKWFQKLIDEDKKILVIDNIDSISKEEQKKFIEILKYKKISTYNLPKDTRIILTARKINNKIDKEIFDLTACIGG